MNELRLSPGGTEITRRALVLCGFERGARVADIGCGAGVTVALLREDYGLDATGIDSDAALVAGLSDPNILCGAAEHLPFERRSLSGLFFECSMSKIRDIASALRECARALAPGGRLIVSDLFARGEPRFFDGALYRLESWDEIRARIEGAGFRLLHFEDFSKALVQLWGKLIFAHGTEALCEDFGTDYETLRRAKCGYFLAIFELV